MTRIILLLAVIGIALILWHKISNAKGNQRQNLIFWIVTGTLIGIMVFLVITGRMNWLYALGGTIAAFIPRLVNALKYLPVINRFRQQYSQHQTGQQQNRSSGKRARNGKMTARQACEILGIKPGATREEIIAAHKRMIQKVHPDRGGSDYLAAQINEARDTLLG